jgi:hypothetical protein
VSDPADLLAAAQRDETLAVVAACYCARLDPGNVDTYERALQMVGLRDSPLPFKAPESSDYPDADPGRAQYRADLAARRLAYLEGRVAVVRERQEFRSRIAESSLPDLDGAVEAIRHDPEALAELHRERFEQRQADRAAAVESVAQRVAERARRRR